MAPPVSAIPVSELEAQVNTLSSGKSRNPPIVLGDCALSEFVQYKCNVEKGEKGGRGSQIVCEPVVRMLRRCQGGPSVETTAWEEWKANQEDASRKK